MLVIGHTSGSRVGIFHLRKFQDGIRDWLILRLGIRDGIRDCQKISGRDSGWLKKLRAGRDSGRDRVPRPALPKSVTKVGSSTSEKGCLVQARKCNIFRSNDENSPKTLFWKNAMLSAHTLGCDRKMFSKTLLFLLQHFLSLIQDRSTLLQVLRDLRFSHELRSLLCFNYLSRSSDSDKRLQNSEIFKGCRHTPAQLAARNNHVCVCFKELHSFF